MYVCQGILLLIMYSKKTDNGVLLPTPIPTPFTSRGRYCFETSSLFYDEDKIYFFQIDTKMFLVQRWDLLNILRFSTYIFLKIFNKSFKLFLIYVRLLKPQKTNVPNFCFPKNLFGNERSRALLDKPNKAVSATQILKYLLGVFLRSQDKAHYVLFNLILRQR